MVPWEKWGMIKVLSIHPKGTINVGTTFRANASGTSWDNSLVKWKPAGEEKSGYKECLDETSSGDHENLHQYQWQSKQL